MDNIYNELLFSQKKILPSAIRMNLKNIVPYEIIQEEKDTYCVISITCRI
jgi:hypothetical protein